MHDQLHINGAWRDGASGERFAVVNPADESTLAEVASASERDAAEALEGAERAQPPWAARPPRERAEHLRRAYELLIERREDFARLITLEHGKPLHDSRGEVLYAAEFFRWYSEEAVRGGGELSLAPASGAQSLVRWKPIGLAFLITPWNFPLAMAARKIAPALAAGCACLLKPASETPLSALALAALLQEAGVDGGLVQTLPSKRAGPLAEFVLADQRVRALSFTGSTEVGRLLLARAAERVLKTAMELGGNAPFIVLADADLPAAVEGCMTAKMRGIGEACTAANRILVHASVAEPFLEALTARMAALKLGDGLDESNDVGPLVSAEARARVHALVEDALAKGAELRLGGELPGSSQAPGGSRGFFYPPTVLAAVPEGADCLREEIFGPVAAVQTFGDEAEALQRANATEYGLVAYLYTRNFARGLAFAEALDFGMVGLNRGLVSDPAFPFGGVKQSGLGREGGREGMREFMEQQYISTEW